MAVCGAIDGCPTMRGVSRAQDGNLEYPASIPELISEVFQPRGYVSCTSTVTGFSGVVSRTLSSGRSSTVQRSGAGAPFKLSAFRRRCRTIQCSFVPAREPVPPTTGAMAPVCQLRASSPCIPTQGGSGTGDRPRPGAKDGPARPLLRKPPVLHPLETSRL